MTPLHLAAQKNKLNSAHLLLEAGADRDICNEKRQRPIDLCENNLPMKSLLERKEMKTRELNSYNTQESQVLTAAKDLLENTLKPVSDTEEKIILACKKVKEDASKCEKNKTDEPAEIQRAFNDHKQVSDEFQDVITLVEEYRNSLSANRHNVNYMGTTLAETHRSVTTQLQSKRTSNAATRLRISRLGEKLVELKDEYEDVTKEIEEIERRARELRERKAELEELISQNENESSTLQNNERSESKNETNMAVKEESLQKTRSLIETGDSSLNTLQDRNADRLLNIGLEYAQFLRRYNDLINETIEQYNFKLKTMETRIQDEKQYSQDAPRLRLEMDKNKFDALIQEYQVNLDRFQKLKRKALQIQEKVKYDYSIVAQLVGEFGRELDPLNPCPEETE